MKVGDLVRYSRKAPTHVLALVGVVAETNNFKHVSGQQVLVLWNTTPARTGRNPRWHSAPCLEVLNETR